MLFYLNMFHRNKTSLFKTQLKHGGELGIKNLTLSNFFELSSVCCIKILPLIMILNLHRFVIPAPV